MDLPGIIEIYEDNQRSVMGGWNDGVAEADSYRYEGTYTMHQHFIDSIREGRVRREQRPARCGPHDSVADQIEGHCEQCRDCGCRLPWTHGQQSISMRWDMRLL
ncbi:MAG: hypothetical protein R2867_41445 [Caldilineaceae bacterium]